MEARKTTVAVGAMGATGSGVVVSADGTGADCGACGDQFGDRCEVADTVSILFDDGEEFQAKVLG